ncbi:MAG: succinylglutamate desuccinylase/aspartoacylase family protein [Armatimonadetes bacterium]|nr:succinylglutamate desuccinylase/aspartoacylase family protein [Armatimonadota bacterium]
MTRNNVRLLLGCLLVASRGGAEMPSLSYNPTYSETVRFLVAAGEASELVSVATIGQSAKGRQIPVAMVHDPRVSPLEVTRILVLARQHGNEPAGTVAVLGLLKDIMAGRGELPAQLSRICLVIVPMINPDGAEANRRSNARGADLNRDWIYRKQPETQAVEYLFNLWDPHVVLDLHELHWNDKHGLNTIEAPQAGVSLAAMGDDSRRLQSLILARLKGAGFPARVSSWDESCNMNLCHRHYARDHGRVSLLFESERQGLRTPLPRRAAMHRIGLDAVLDYYATDGMELRYPRLALAPASPEGGPLMPELGANAAEGISLEARPAEPAVMIVSPELDRPLSGQVRLQVEVEGIGDLSYISIRIDGQSRFFSNRGPYAFDLDTARLGAGRHAILVRAHRRDGSVVEQEYLVTVS